ncbi:MAG: hypothetical protein Tsb006_3530 [Rickettsiaceae bacterium]
MEADLLIVCDGSNSLIKQKYFSSEIDKLYSQYAITFIVRHEKPHEGTAVEHFMPSGPFAILPLKDQHLSSIVWTVRSEMKGALLKLPQEEFLYLVQQNLGDFLGRVNLQSEAAAFPLKAYSTSKYFNKKIALVADSAHVIHPLAGQGLNQGIKDIHSLVTNILKHGACKFALGRYEESRKSDNKTMLEITDTLNALFATNSKLLHASRQLGFKAIGKISPFKKLLIKYAMGKR